MLEHTTFDVYKHYTGFICVEEQEEYVVRGAFNKVNVGKNKDEYVIGIEQGVIDTNLLHLIVPSGLVLGRLINNVAEHSSINLVLIYKVTDNNTQKIVTDIAKGDKVNEWSLTDASPKMLIMGDAYSPLISGVKVLSFSGKSLSVNQGLSMRTREVQLPWPVSNREYQTPSIYGPLV